jgi:putative oxidoreductase
MRTGKKRGARLNETVKKLWANRWVEVAARWFLGLTFIYASYDKIISPGLFAHIINDYNLFPGFSINLIAIILPHVELFCGLALVLGIYPRSAALILIGMLTGFIIALSINLFRGHEFECGCFTLAESVEKSSTTWWIIRDIIYVVAGLQVIFYDEPRKWCLRQTGSILHNLNRSS